MKILYFDCSSGISGDMAVGAMIDLGVPFEILNIKLDHIELQQKRISKKGISAVKFDVYEKSTHKHADHSHHHVENIEKIILETNIPDSAKKIALGIFAAIADAERIVHGTPKGKSLHLHEVGALDSIADIICLSLCVDYLKPDKIIFSPLNTGEGTVKCAHGILPVPAPATLELLKNIPAYSDGTKFELTTPTGAAFAKITANEFGGLPFGKIIKAGYGAGSRELDNRPNVLRVLLIDASDNDRQDACPADNNDRQDACPADNNDRQDACPADNNDRQDACPTFIYQMETQIDDMTSETLAPVFDKLLKNGALDVYVTQILMKKQRPGFLLTVLSNSENKNDLEKIILTDTTTFGVRSWKIDRICLDRKIEKFDSSLGTVRVKIGTLDNITKKMPELDDCLLISEKYNIPVWKVYNKIIGELNEK